MTKVLHYCLRFSVLGRDPTHPGKSLNSNSVMESHGKVTECNISLGKSCHGKVMIMAHKYYELYIFTPVHFSD